MAKTKHPPNALRLWMREATPEEQEALAQAGDTSRGMLYQVAGGHRRFSAAKAGALASHAQAAAKASGGRLPVLYRTDLAEACALCEYARQCIGPRADLDVIDPGN